MKKWKLKEEMTLFVCICTAVAMFSGCAGKEEPEEIYEAVDYRLYPSPENAFVGDIMPFVTNEGTLELYYLYDTIQNGQGYHPIYKYSTKNLCEYSDDGMMLNFGTMAEPDPAIGTGSVLQDKDGLYHLFYTGHNDIDSGGKGKECVMHATSTDRQNWVKIPEDTFYSPYNYSKDDFRDPEVFWVEEDQCYWLLIAAREDGHEGSIIKYTSKDLKNWEFTGPYFAPDKQYMLECPDLFKMGDKYYLTYSWDCVTYYVMSDSMDGEFIVPEDNVLDGNGFIFYAAKTAEFNNHQYLCGWLGRSALGEDDGLYQWAGSVLIHQLVQKEDGMLGVTAPDMFYDYFTVEKPLKMSGSIGKVKAKKDTIQLRPKKDSYALADLGMREPTMLLECDVTMDDNGCVGFAFGGKDKGAYTCLCLDAEEGTIHYEGAVLGELDQSETVAYTKFDFSRSNTHHVKLVCENEIVVLYIDDTKALSSRIFSGTDGGHIGVFADSADTEFSNIMMKLKP